MEQDYLISKAARDWKNISQRQDERQQGRAGARYGAQIVGGGATLAGLGWTAGNAFPDQAGDPVAASKYVRYLSKHPDLTRAEKAKFIAAKIGKTPSLAVTAAGVGAGAVGSGMWAAGRAKSRHADAEIARLRRQRARR